SGRRSRPKTKERHPLAPAVLGSRGRCGTRTPLIRHINNVITLGLAGGGVVRVGGGSGLIGCEQAAQVNPRRVGQRRLERYTIRSAAGAGPTELEVVSGCLGDRQRHAVSSNRNRGAVGQTQGVTRTRGKG